MVGKVTLTEGFMIKGSVTSTCTVGRLQKAFCHRPWAFLLGSS